MFALPAISSLCLLTSIYPTICSQTIAQQYDSSCGLLAKLITNLS